MILIHLVDGLSDIVHRADETPQQFDTAAWNSQLIRNGTRGGVNILTARYLLVIALTPALRILPDKRGSDAIKAELVMLAPCVP
jgi:hypothetical protein